MKKNFKAIGQMALVFATGMVILSSCVSDPDSPGLEYMPDMYRSPAIEPYVDYGEIRRETREDLKVQQSAMRPPNYTIPYYGTDSSYVSLMLPYHRKASSAADKTHGLYPREGWRLSDSVNTEYELAKMDNNPIKLTAENSEAIFKDGKQIYESKCSHCHGEKGDGKGPMVESGAYAGVPDYANLKELGDGQIFYSIYYGKGAMGAHSMLLNKKEIWTLVHYVNKFRFEDYGKFNEGGDAMSGAPSDSLNVQSADTVSVQN
ncbi:MAG: cytochrome c [Brumimicrobium sp.]|nr:cytochrome c [Brumimicrobium sp.]